MYIKINTHLIKCIIDSVLSATSYYQREKEYIKYQQPSKEDKKFANP